MAKKRKATAIVQPQEQKPKIVPEEEEESSEGEEESEEEESEEESSSEEEESKSESEDNDDEEEDEDEEDEEEKESSSAQEATEEASKRETIRELLGPLGKPQIIDLLKEAASKDPTILPKIVKFTDADPTHRNVFVFGLGWDATTDQVLQVFKPFGEIEECKVIMDRNTGRAKGYAFVLFKTRAAAKKALKLPQKRIGSKVASCQLAATGSQPSGTVNASEGENLKVYVGNVGPHINPDNLKAFFRKYGEIEDGPIGLDPFTHKFKGFAVITYRTPEGYKKALEEPVKKFENSLFHCKKFVENPNKNNSSAPLQSSVGSIATPGVTDVSFGGLGANSGLINASGLLLAQNAIPGFVGSGMLASGYNPAGLVSGLSTPTAGISGNYGMNSVAPSLIGNYGSQATLHGLGAFQNAQTGQSPIGSVTTTTTATRGPASRVSATMTYPSFFNH